MTDARDELAGLILEGIRETAIYAQPSKGDEFYDEDLSDAVIESHSIDLRKAADAILAAGWVKPTPGISIPRGMLAEWVPKSMKIDLDALPADDERMRDEAAYDEAWQARDWDEVARIQDKWARTDDPMDR